MQEKGFYKEGDTRGKDMESVGEGKRLGRDFFARDGITVARKLLGKVLVHETSVGTVRGVITETESYMGVEDKGSHSYGGRRTQRTEPMFHQGGTSYVYLIYGMYSCMNIVTATEDVPQAVLIRKVEPLDAESEERMRLLKAREIEGKLLRKWERAKQQEADAGVSNSSLSGKQELRTCGNQVQEAKQVLTKEGSMTLTPKEGVVWRKEEETVRETKQEAIREREIVLAQIKEQARQKAEKYKKEALADGPGKLCIVMEIGKKDNDLDMVTSDCFYVTEGYDVAPEKILAGKRIGIDYAEEAADYLWRFYL